MSADSRRVARPGIQIVDGSQEVLAEITLREKEEWGGRLSDATTLVHEKAEVGKGKGKGGWRERGRRVWEGWKKGMRELGTRGCGRIC